MLRMLIITKFHKEIKWILILMTSPSLSTLHLNKIYKTK